jgi:hypothetical protein
LSDPTIADYATFPGNCWSTKIGLGSIKSHIVKAYWRIWAGIICTVSLLIACSKKAPPCVGNCAPMTANGRVVNKLANTAAAGVPVSLRWAKFVGGLSQFELISTVKSRADGSFDLKSDIDTTYFTRGYYLSLNVGQNNEYLILGYSGVIEARTYSYDQAVFQGKQLEVYKKANLNIKLRRLANDNFQSFAISHANVTDFFLYDYNVASPQEVIDRNTSELNVQTVADVYTKVRSVKTFANGTSITTLDSVRCVVGSANTVEVRF